MASSPSNAKVSLQLPLTLIAQCPARLPDKGCHCHPGIFICSGRVATFRAANCSLSFPACFGCIPAFEPLEKNFSMPLCRKLRIISGAVYCVTPRYTTKIKPSPSYPRSSTNTSMQTSGRVPTASQSFPSLAASATSVSDNASASPAESPNRLWARYQAVLA